MNCGQASARIRKAHRWGHRRNCRRGPHSGRCDVDGSRPEGTQFSGGGRPPARSHTGEEASGVAKGENLLRVNAREAASGVAGLDWVDSVTVSRDFPSTLTINVSEHKAVAFVKRDNKPYLIDDKGEEFTSAEPPAGAVEVTGSVDSGSPQTQDAVRAIAALSDDVRNQVAKLEVAGEYSLTFTTKDDRRIFWGASDSNDEDKAHAFATVLKMEGREWNISNPELVTTRG